MKQAGRILDELEALVSAGRGVEVNDLVPQLEKYARTCERELGTDATRRLQAMYYRLILKLYAEPRFQNAAIILRLSQLLKGDTWRAIYVSGAARTHRPNEAEEKNLSMVRQTMYVPPSTEQEVKYGSAGFRIRESLLVTPALAEGMEVDVMKVTGVLDSRLADFYQHVYNLEVQRSLSKASEFVEPVPIGLEEMVQLLDADTVMLDFLVLEHEGAQSVLTIVVTREEVYILFDPVPHLLLFPMSADGIAVNNSPMALAARQLRTEAQVAAGARHEGVATKVEKRTFDDPASFVISKTLGSLLCDLHKRRHKRHLCIIPHGPLHYVPLHLLQVDGRPLANEWTVTTLPSAAVLRASESRMSHRGFRNLV